MPSCAAHGCRSRPENGFRLFKLPSDPRRRLIWLENMGRQDDSVSSSAKLCEMHFLNDQFENKRQDGKKLLRWNAVPTEFGHDRKPGNGKLGKSRGPPKVFTALRAESEVGPGVPHPPTSTEHAYAASSSPSSAPSAGDYVAADTYEMISSNGLPTGDDNAGAGYCCSPQIMEPHPHPTMASGGVDCRRSPEIPAPLAALSSDASWKLRGDFDRLQRRHMALRVSNAKLSKQLLLLKSRAQLLEQKLGTFLNVDQIAKLGQKSTRGSLWSRASVMSALKLKFSCGNTGYSALLGTKYPLPSARTLNRRLQTIDFESGILNEAFDMLRVKVEHMADKERLCSLALVEAPITPGFQHDRSTDASIGAVTLPEHIGTATRGLVFTLGGIASHWKQTVAYYLADCSTNGAVYKPIVIEIVTKAHAVGLHVCSVTSDAESPSQAMWNAFGVQTSGAEVVNRVAHPCRPHDFLYFCPDAHHLLKGFMNALLRHRMAYLSPEHVSMFALPCRVVAVEHLYQVTALQGGRELKMAPSLTEEALSAERFEGTRAELVWRLAGRDVTATMRCMVQFQGWPTDMETTAWFLDLVHDWFQHMTSRHPVLALSKLSAEQYVQALAFLRSVADIFQALRFGPGDAWEPVQSAILLATATVLQLQEDLLEQHHFSYILTARFGQDLLENEMAALLAEGPAPPALLFKQRLSNLAVSQYLLTTRSSPDTQQTHRKAGRATKNEQQGRNLCHPAAADVPDIDVNDWAHAPSVDDINTLIDLASISAPIDDIDKWCLYSLSGYVIAAAKKKHAFCKKCMAQIAAEKGEGIETKIHRFVELKQFRDGRLSFPTSSAFALLCRAEEMFRVQRIALKGQQNLASHVLELTIKHSEDIPILDCHEAKRRFLEEFLRVRQRISTKYMSKSWNQSSAE